jgi:endonuclease YncB( thermonuclease family)
MAHIRNLLLLVALLIPTTALADFSGPVVSVLDGDTIEVLHHSKAERIQLSGIDCPANDPAS